MRSDPEIGVEEVDADEVVVRIAATPTAESDGRRLADEILAAIAPVTREGHTEEREAARAADDNGQSGQGPRPRAEPPGHVTQEFES